MLNNCDAIVPFCSVAYKVDAGVEFDAVIFCSMILVMLSLNNPGLCIL
jgi:hypothetical protein